MKWEFRSREKPGVLGPGRGGPPKFPQILCSSGKVLQPTLCKRRLLSMELEGPCAVGRERVGVTQMPDWQKSGAKSLRKEGQGLCWLLLRWNNGDRTRLPQVSQGSPCSLCSGPVSRLCPPDFGSTSSIDALSLVSSANLLFCFLL